MLILFGYGVLVAIALPVFVWGILHAVEIEDDYEND